MSLLAAVVDWDNPAPPEAQVSALLSRPADRAPDGRWYCSAPHAVLGFGRGVVRERERGEVQPFQDHRRGLFAVGDLRLDNRDELRAVLDDGASSLDSDIAILVAGYERWG